MRERLRAARVRGVDRVQGAETHEEKAPDRESECGADRRDDPDLDEMLEEHLPAARSERATDADDRRVVQELREQQAYGVEQADREECERETDEHTVVVLDDLVVDQPLIHFRQAVVERALETPGLFLSQGVVVDKRLEALLQPDFDDAASVEAMDQLRALVRTLASEPAEAGLDPPLSFAVVRQWLEEKLAAVPERQRFLAGGITVWEPKLEAGDPLCCPSSQTKTTYTFDPSNGGLKGAGSTVVPTSQLPTR